MRRISQPRRGGVNARLLPSAGMNPSPNLVLVGPMGAGKTSIGRRLSERFGLPFVDADREIEAQTGASVTTIFECEGETGFRARERALLAQLLAEAGRVVATGGGAVIDDGSRQLLRERGFVVYLHADVPAQLARLARDRTRPLLQRPDREAVLQQLAEARAPLYAEVADLRYDTSQHACSDAATRLAALLAERWQRVPAHGATPE
jgi:shikimate kinase